MNPFVTCGIRITACALVSIAALTTAQAQPLRNAEVRGAAVRADNGAFAAQGTTSTYGSNGAAAGRRGVSGDGNGNVSGSSAGGYTTAAGGQGGRTSQFSRSADGSVSASSNASATGRNGNSIDASSSFTKGSGISRSVTCTDSAGNAVTCGSR